MIRERKVRISCPIPFCHEVVWEGPINDDWVKKLREHRETHSWFMIRFNDLISAWGRWRLHHVIHKYPELQHPPNPTDPSTRPSDLEKLL